MIIQNTLSVDIEEYFHAKNLEMVAPRSKWDSLSSRVEPETYRVLRLLAEHKISATFFILGYVARHHPRLIKDITKNGHEVASHGYSHKMVYQQTPQSFYQDVYRTRSLLEDICSTRVIGYRAPNFSITDNTPWAYDILRKVGYLYDSSLYPIRHSRYNNSHKPRFPFLVRCSSGKLAIFPLAVSTFSIYGYEIRLPVAGGAYWRLLPQWFNNWGLSRINQVEKSPMHCYFHPWELDNEQPRFHSLPPLLAWRHYAGLSTFSKRLEFFLKNFSFGTLRDAYEKFVMSSNNSTNIDSDEYTES